MTQQFFRRAVVLNVKQQRLNRVNGSESRLLYELSNYLSWSGLSDPEHQVKRYFTVCLWFGYINILTRCYYEAD
jgi:hypothetical protein